MPPQDRAAGLEPRQPRSMTGPAMIGERFVLLEAGTALAATPGAASVLLPLRTGTRQPSSADHASVSESSSRKLRGDTTPRAGECDGAPKCQQKRPRTVSSRRCWHRRGLGEIASAMRSIRRRSGEPGGQVLGLTLGGTTPTRNGRRHPVSASGSGTTDLNIRGPLGRRPGGHLANGVAVAGRRCQTAGDRGAAGTSRTSRITGATSTHSTAPVPPAARAWTRSVAPSPER
jgi:hypothetical protein